MLSIFLAVLVLGAVFSFAGPDTRQAAKDWAQMDKMLTEREKFQYQSSFEKHPDEFVSNWLDFSENFTAAAGDFAERYGSDRTSLQDFFQKVIKPSEADRECFIFVDQYLFAVSDMERMHRQITDWAESMGKDNYLRWEQMTDTDNTKTELKYRYARRALAGYNAAAKLNPDSDYSELVKKAESAERETKDLYIKTMESIKWPGHNKNFTGPGNPGELSEAALEFLRNNPKWSRPEYDDEHIPYAACVTGSGWEVYKTAPLTNVPTQYSLDMLVAFTGKNDPDIVYAYNMVFYTAEESGVKKALPFRYANSKQYQKYQMLKKSVTKGPSGVQPVSGGFGLGRLIFGLLLIAGGIMGSKNLLALKINNSGEMIEKLAFLYFPLGILLTLTGFLGFIFNLFSLSPFASLLPQISALILGLVFIHKSPGPVPLSITEKLGLLEPAEPLMGAAGIVLGFLHLIIGGMRFF